MNYIDSITTREVDGLGVGIVRLKGPADVLSCAVLNGGRSRSSAFFVMQVPKDYDHDDPATHAAMVRDVFGLPEDSVGMMTAAEVSMVFTVETASYNGMDVTAVVTTGLSNHVVAGETLDNYPERRAVSDCRGACMAGTINIAVLSPVPLTDVGMVNMMIPLVEGKSAAMGDRGYRETGTTSDSMAVFCPIGDDRVIYTGTGSDVGIAAARAVRRAVGSAMAIRGEHPVWEEPFRIMERMGYDVSSLQSMSGADLPEDVFRWRMAETLSEPRVRALLDLALFSADRADSMAEDGHPEVRDLIGGMMYNVLGIDQDMSRGTVESVLSAISRYSVIDDE